CSLGHLGNGRSASITIVVTTTTAGTLTNTATVRGSETDPNPHNNSDTAITSVIGGYRATWTSAIGGGAVGVTRAGHGNPGRAGRSRLGPGGGEPAAAALTRLRQPLPLVEPRVHCSQRFAVSRNAIWKEHA